MEKSGKRLNRRHFLELTTSAGMGALLAGCNFPAFRQGALSTTFPRPEAAASQAEQPTRLVTETPTVQITPGSTLFPTGTAAANNITLTSPFQLPCSLDFSVLADTKLPEWFTGPTWQIAGGYLANSPTPGEALPGNPGLESACADGFLGTVPLDSFFGFFPATQPDIVIKIKPDDPIDDTPLGIVLRSNSAAHPVDYLLILISVQAGWPTNSVLNVFQVTDSACRHLVSQALLGERVSAAWLEVRAEGSVVSIYYNHVKIGNDLIIEAQDLTTGVYHGVFSAGKNRLKALYLAEKLVPRVQVYGGSSFSASEGYRPEVNTYCLEHFPGFDYTFRVLAEGRHNTWSNLVRLATGGDLFVLDHANDLSAVYAEAMILRLWEKNPETQIVLITSPTWYTRDTSDDSQVNTPANLSVLQDVDTLAAHYGIALVDYWSWCKQVVNSGQYHLDELTEDTIHPSKIGYTAMASLMENLLPDGGTAKPVLLPDRLFTSSSFFQATPIRIPGTSFTSRTGSGWVDEDTTISSSTTGDTVTYSTKSMWSSFGDWRSDYKPNEVEISLNDGPFESMSFQQNGYPMYSDIYHTITIRIPEGGNVKIEEVWLL